MIQVLDGKNHHRGAYEKLALGLIVDILNTGRHWGWLDHPVTAAAYTPEAIQRANSAFLNTFRRLVDQWIDSGIDEDGSETPVRRYVRGDRPKGYSESLFDILYAWLARNMPRPALMSEGTIAIVDQRPSPHGLDPESYARESAIYWLKELLECSAPHRLRRCANPRCRKYFLRQREQKGRIKRGAYCGQRRREQQLEAAAKAWKRWKRNNTHPTQKCWVAQQVNKQLRWSDVGAKWVTQNLQEILRRTGNGPPPAFSDRA